MSSTLSFFEASRLTAEIEIRQARTEDAREIADLHIAARRISMPYLHEPFTEDETRAWFARAVGDRSEAWWVAHHAGQIVGYMFLHKQYLDHLYVRSDWQGRGIGSLLLDKAKTLSPRRLELSAFKRNANARSFYEARGFHIIGCTDGQNNEHEPDVQYVWSGGQ
jgi:ribosomal protein S18 acetylase RimI-like enzyme